MTQPAPTPTPKASFLSTLGAKLLKLAKNPVVKPLEVWALRAALTYLAVKLGISIDHSVQMVCACHGEPMYRNNSVGGWRCRVKVRERQRPADLAYWHKQDGGYIRRRRRHLAAQRAETLRLLSVIEQEAATC